MFYMLCLIKIKRCKKQKIHKADLDFVYLWNGAIWHEMTSSCLWDMAAILAYIVEYFYCSTLYGLEQSKFNKFVSMKRSFFPLITFFFSSIVHTTIYRNLWEMINLFFYNYIEITSYFNHLCLLFIDKGSTIPMTPSTYPSSTS